MTIEPSHAPRYAIYFAPESDSPWWRLGAGLLGRNEGGGVPPPHTAPPGGIDPDRWHRMTAEARRYGFHATLKAPFRLDTRASLPMLTERVSALAATLRSIPLGPLDPKPFPGFVALAPATSPQGLAELAARCVVELDDLRAPALAAARPRTASRVRIPTRPGTLPIPHDGGELRAGRSRAAAHRGAFASHRSIEPRCAIASGPPVPVRGSGSRGRLAPSSRLGACALSQ